MRILELYSGIGGMHYAFSESGVPGIVIAAVEINTVANQVYAHNFPKVNNVNRNIESLSAKEILKMNIDSIFMSPPCQPFTRVGLQKDSKDNRSSSFFHVLNIIPEITSLKYILVENVKGFEKSQTRDALISCLVKAGFNYKELILSPCQFGVPNTRHRYYLLAKRKDLQFCFSNSELAYSIPEEIVKHLPKTVHMQLAIEDNAANDVDPLRQCYRLQHIIEESVDTEPYKLSDQLLEKRASVLDIRSPESRGSCCFTKAYGRYVEGTGSTLSPMPQETVDNKISEYQMLRETSKDFLKPLIELKLRFFTPTEVSRLMCFPKSFHFPNTITNKQIYRLLGNSINVHVVSRLIYLLNLEGNLV